MVPVLTFRHQSTNPPIRRTDKHGQLGIWDPRASVDEVGDDEEADPEVQEGGKYWRLQMHWPATSRSSISCIRFDPTDTHSVSLPNLTIGYSGLPKPCVTDLHKLL